MNKVVISIAAFALMACSSAQSTKTSSDETPKMEQTNANSSSSSDDQDSRVLNKSKKCPKNSKVVNGKCMLNVESDD